MRLSLVCNFQVVLPSDFAVIAGSTDATREKCSFGSVVDK